MKNIAITVFLIMLAAGFYLYQADQLIDIEGIRAYIFNLGPWAPIAYIFAISLLNPYFVPVLTFLVPGALIWEFPTLLLYTWLGVVGSAVHGFLFARYLGRDFVVQHLPARLVNHHKRISDKDFKTTLIVRLTFGIIPPAHWVLGISPVRFIPHLLGTSIGYFPMTLLLTYLVSVLGTTLGAWLQAQSPSVWWSVGLSITVLILLRIWWRQRRYGPRS